MALFVHVNSESNNFDCMHGCYTSGRIVLPIYGTIILSEPHIDEVAVEFVYIIILLNVKLCSN